MSVVWAIRESYTRLEDPDQGSIVTVATPAIPALADEPPVPTAYGRAVEGLTGSQAATFAPGARVNAVIPGPRETEDPEAVLAEFRYE